MGIYYGGKYHNAIYYGGKYHSAAYLGPNKIWGKSGSGTVVTPTDANTKLLLHGTSLSDSSMYKTALTNSGVTITAAQSKFALYPSAYYFNGNNIAISASKLFTGNIPFTLEAWIYTTVSKDANIIFSWNGSNTSNGNGGVITLDGTTIVYYAYGDRLSGTLTINAWHHIAFIGNDTSLMLFVDGVLQESETITYSLNDATVHIGANGSAISNEYFTGYMTEIRFSDIARWTENFTPPTEPYST